MKLAVLGATGGTGVHLVRQALERGHRVTAVVRDPLRLPVEHESLEVVTADITSAEALLPVVSAQDAVLSALGARGNKQAGIVSRACRAVLEAMGEGRVRRLIVVSAAPVGPSPEGEGPVVRFLVTPLVRRAFAPQYADLAAMEEAVAASTDLEWTIVRPPRLLDGSGTGTYRRSLGGNVPNGTSLDRADLARALLDSVDDRGTVGRVVGVAR